MTSLTESDAKGSGNYTVYTWTYDADNEVTSFGNSAHANESVGSYTYAQGQLVNVAPISRQSANASNSLANVYDANGNATSITVAGGTPTTTTIGPDNELIFDGTYNDTYDADGNLVKQQDSTTKITYTYDNRNRLTSVTTYAWQSNSWVQTQQVTYTYDMFNNLIGRTVTGTGATKQEYVFDGTNIVLAFDGNDNLTDRYLWGPAVDQVLADEHFSLTGQYHSPRRRAQPTGCWRITRTPCATW